MYHQTPALRYESLIVNVLARKFNSGIREMADGWVRTMSEIAHSVHYTEGLPWEINLDWVRDAAMAAVELGLPLRPESVLRLLTDREYFESLLPIPMTDPRWRIGALSGTESLWQWWQLYPEEYRTLQSSLFEKVFQCIPSNAFRCLASYRLATELP